LIVSGSSSSLAQCSNVDPVCIRYSGSVDMGHKRSLRCSQFMKIVRMHCPYLTASEAASSALGRIQLDSGVQRRHTLGGPTNSKLFILCR
jgi:hypothetical protein